MAEFTWSYSSLKQYQNCPRQYHEIRVLKNYTAKESEAMIYGKEVHKALEEYVRDGVELAKNYQRFKSSIDALVNVPGKKLVEYEMALNYRKEPCDFKDPNRWVRGIADLVIIDGDYAFVVDYKTGSNRYPDPKQLRLMALMLFTHFPEIQKIKAGLLFVMKNSFLTEEYLRRDMDKSWKMFEVPLKRLENSYDNDTWTPNPTPLCGWCPVKNCEFHKEK
jgi:CRISPR/Cas system-associated exonuclease Cas4 (RecB family)